MDVGGRECYDTETMNAKKIYVGMSGGVDSSLSAALLKQQGHHVVGVFIKVWQADFLPCNWRNERRDAMRVAAHLNIPFKTLDLENEYKHGVVEKMIAEYREGRTPNPDVLCNKEVKFGAFLDFAKREGADAVATGHYAQILPMDGVPVLATGVDVHKDQSYFLWMLEQTELPFIHFPIGHLEKSEVRKLATVLGLPTAHKKDSQGLCFLGPVDMKDFLSHFVDQVPGEVRDENGEVIGSHEGAVFYTLGQRHGFSTNKTTRNERPYFVIGKNMTENAIIVSHEIRNDFDDSSRMTKLKDFRTTLGREQFWERYEGKHVHARYRYRQSLRSCVLTKGESVQVTWSETEEHIAPGQSVVLYDGMYCLGGGIVI